MLWFWGDVFLRCSLAREFTSIEEPGFAVSDLAGGGAGGASLEPGRTGFEAQLHHLLAS